MIRTILFDLDGTLIDSIDLILASYRQTLNRHGFAPVPDRVWLAGVGRPLRVQLGPWASSPEHLNQLVATYREYNLANHDRMVRPFQGVPEVVRSLAAAGIRLAVVTSKNQEGAERGLRVAGISGEITVRVCADDVVNPKPHPEPVTRALALLGAEPASTVFVGDSIHDLTSGREAGVLTGAVLWGPFGRADLEPGSPDHWLENPTDILRLAGLTV